MIVLQNAPEGTRTLPGLALRAEPAENHAAKFDLTLYVTEAGGELHCSLEYALDLFEAATIERMAGHLLGLFEAIGRTPRSAWRSCRCSPRRSARASCTTGTTPW